MKQERFCYEEQRMKQQYPRFALRRKASSITNYELRITN